MSNGPALYLGRIGSTGTSTAPHGHFEVKKDGKYFPLSQARTDIGQYLQYRKPNEKEWTPFFTKQGETFQQAPGVVLTSPMGMREHPVHGGMKEHRGEDYGNLPEGTQLRFVGQGSVATHANQGGAGNVTSLRTGPYEFQSFHMSELPVASTTRTSDAPATVAATPVAATQETSGRVDDILKAFLYGQEYNKEPKKTFEQGLKEQLVGGLISQAMNPMSFLSSYSTGDPFLSGRSAATSDFLGRTFG